MSRDLPPLPMPTGKPFPLSASFAAVSLLVIGLATGIVMLLIARQERHSLIARGEEYAVEIASHLDDRIARDFVRPRGRLRPEGPAEYDELDRIVRDCVRPFRVETVLLFDPEGRIFYSTNPAYLGKEHEKERGIAVALSGGVHSSFKRAETRFDIDGTRTPRDLLETYAPLRSAESGEPSGVLEIYQDATSISRQIDAARWQVAAITVSTMGALFLALLLIVLKAERLIVSQTRQIETQNAVLEERVRERTQALAQTQNQLIEAAPLAAVGTLAAGVAHEINNPIASVAACAEGLISRAEKAPFRDDPAFADFSEYLGIIRTESFRVKTITRRLLDLARAGPFSPRPVDLPSLIEDIRILLSHHAAVREGRLRIGDCGLQLEADPAQLKQVVLNLMKNAIDAIDGMPEGRVDVACRTEGGFGIIAFRDNGAGFPPEDRERLFTPFYSTKGPGKGTGLGLPLSLSIVERHGGRIHAESPGRGQGALFEVHLPLRALAKDLHVLTPG